MKEPLEFESLDQMAETTASALVKAAAESAFHLFHDKRFQRLGWHWREAPVFAVLDLLSIQEPIPKKTCAYLGEMTEDPSGRPGRTFRTDSFRIWTVPGFAPGGLVTYLAMVQETGTTPPVRALL
jgi:hypothetical protein